MVEKCGSCSRSRTSIPELIDHYANSHNTTKGNSLVFESYVDVLTNLLQSFLWKSVNTVVRRSLMEN